MRAITVAAPWIACCIASALGAASLGGCYRSHESVTDAGPIDARPPADAPPLDAREPDARAPLPSCRDPVARWTPTEVEIAGRRARGLARLRDGERTWIASSSEDGRIHLHDIDYAGPLPVVARDIVLDVVGIPLAGAMDEARVAIVYATVGPPAPFLGLVIADPDGRPLVEGLLMEPAGPTTLALRGTRVGLASGGESIPFVSLIDASDGRVVGGEAFPGSAEASIGLGRGLFNAVVTPTSGDSRLVGVDDLGTIDAGTLGLRMVAMTWDGTVVAGVETSGALVVRVAAGRVERFVPPRAVVTPSLAMRRGDPWVAAPSVDGQLLFASEEGFLERSVAAPSPRYTIAAHASQRHVGAFVLVDGSELRWVGWSCDPDR